MRPDRRTRIHGPALIPKRSPSRSAATFRPPTKPGEIGALMRRKAISLSALSIWQHQRDSADLAMLAPQKRGPRADPHRAETLHIAQLTRERDSLESRLDKALLVIDVQ